jgi:hypothetical protein
MAGHSEKKAIYEWTLNSWALKTGRCHGEARDKTLDISIDRHIRHAPGGQYQWSEVDSLGAAV